jgi:hypothetical protein
VGDPVAGRACACALAPPACCCYAVFEPPTQTPGRAMA